MGRQATVTDASGTTTDHYDAEGNLIEQDTPEGTMEVPIDYGYDPVTGQHTSTSTADTSTVYHYNTLGQLDTVTVTKLNGSTLSSSLITSYTYDAVGNKLTETLPDGEVTTYGYDDLNRLLTETQMQGGTTLLSETYTLNDDGTRQTLHQTQLQSDNTTVVTTDTSWTYDADGRLTGEAVSSSNSAESYSDTFSYDLAGNRVKQVHSGPGDGATATTVYVYNSDDQLTAQGVDTNGDGVPDATTSTTFTYDNNGSELSSTTGGVVTAYSYDVRNKMIGSSVGSTYATYVYDDAGNRVQETVNGTTTYYLTDHENPTGYAQPLEAKSSATAAPSQTYLIADRVFGQVNASGAVSYLLSDGHGSTEAVTSSTGTVTAAFRYDAFGGGINFSLATAPTIFLFGGDAVYDPASGLYMHGDGVRDRSGFRFIEADIQKNGSDSEPISLHKYLYADADSINVYDPSGYDGDLVELEGAASESASLDGISNRATGSTSIILRTELTLIRATTIAFRTYQYLPLITGVASLGLATVQTGLTFMASAAYRWAELQGVPPGAITRGNFLEQQAGMNLGRYFPVIDDFRGGFATSIKTTNPSTSDALISSVGGYLKELQGIENRRLTGQDTAGNQLFINPGQIQAKGLLVGIPGASAGMLSDPLLAGEIEELAKEADTVVQIVPIDAFKE
jgi:YD repeat-containing protein